MKRARYNASAAVLGEYIYVAGGQDSEETDSVELYDPKCDEWTTINPMQVTRSAFALIEYNGCLYAIGGENHMIEKYNPYKNCWTEVRDKT